MVKVEEVKRGKKSRCVPEWKRTSTGFEGTCTENACLISQQNVFFFLLNGTLFIQRTASNDI